MEHLIYGIDIETSRIPIDGKHDKNDPLSYIQNMYLGVIKSIDMKTGVVYNVATVRTVNELIDALYDLSIKKKIIVYAHNLSYELDFIIRELKPSTLIRDDSYDEYTNEKHECIYRDSNAPLYIAFEELPNVLFKDSYALLGKSISKCGEELNKMYGYNYSKLDCDHSVIRLPWDDLEKEEPEVIEYCERDVDIMLVSIFHLMDSNPYTKGIKIDAIPLTKTSLMKLQRFNKISKTVLVGNKQHRKVSNLNQLVADKYERKYTNFYLHQLFMDSMTGGFVGATPSQAFKLLENLLEIDIKSAYPHALLTKKYPYFEGTTTKNYVGDSASDFYYDFLHGIEHTELMDVGSHLIRDYNKENDANVVNVKAYVMRATFKNLKLLSNDYPPMLSLDKCMTPSNKKDYGELRTVNGKILYAQEITFTLNNVTMDIINKVYDYDGIEVETLWTTSKTNYLRIEEIKIIIESYLIKENSEKGSFDYAFFKALLNSLYGIKTQKVMKPIVKYECGEKLITKFDDIKDVDERECIFLRKTFDYDERKIIFDKSFDLDYHGSFVTAFARHYLSSTFVELVDNGVKVAYSDTDSIKILIEKNLKLVTSIIENINNRVHEENKENPRIKMASTLMEIESEDLEKIYNIGLWDIENKRDREGNLLLTKGFKTLGAKKYGKVTYMEIKKEKDLDFIKSLGDNNKYKIGDMVEMIETTIAGCSKGIAHSIMKYANKNKMPYNKALDFLFAQGTLFDTSCSGRLIAHREKRTDEECATFKYKGRALNTKGGTQLIETTYHLNTTEHDSFIYGLEYEPKPTVIINDKGDVEFIYYEL